MKTWKPRPDGLLARIDGKVLSPSGVFRRYGLARGLSYQVIYKRMKAGRKGMDIIRIGPTELADFAPDAKLTTRRERRVDAIRTEQERINELRERLMRESGLT